MSSHTEPAQPTALFRFLDAFLREENIKWVLGAGLVILLGSSAMAVGSHWGNYTPVWKYLVMLAYTVVIYGAGQVSYRHLSLRTTGTVLMALTVLLLPILFAGWHGLSVGGAGLGIAGISLLGTTIAFTWVAAGRIFRHFLRGAQLTFTASYLLLCLAGALVPLLPTGASPLVAFGLWGIFLVGSVKVNRHVFWLVEEYQRPRIFGFFPIALLGAQFLSVFVLHLAWQMDIAWIGFGLALVALPILLTADAVVRVHQQRTADLAPPRAAVMVPFVVGLVACVAAMPMAAAGFFAGSSVYALVPTALVVGVVMALVARRTERSAFVWGMLGCSLVAYNFSPVFFQELARLAIAQGAAAVREETLPYAFYGLTYLPLLAGLTFVGARLLRQGKALFGRPIRALAIVLPCLLAVTSVTEIKAVLPVGLSMAVLFGIQAFAFRKPWLLLLAGAAWLHAAIGSVFFWNTMVGEVGSSAPLGWVFLVTALAAAALLGVGPFIDRSFDRSLDRSLGRGAGCTLRYLEATGVVATAAVSLAWLVIGGVSLLLDVGDPLWAMAAAAVVGVGSLVRVRLRFPGHVPAAMAIFAAYGSALLLRATFGPAGSTVASVLSVVLLLHWLAIYLLRRWSGSPAIGLFLPDLRAIAYGGLYLALGAATILPLLLPSGIIIWWPVRIALGVWSFDAARRLRSRSAVYVALAAMFGMVTAGALDSFGLGVGREWLPLVWTCLAIGVAAATRVPRVWSRLGFDAVTLGESTLRFSRIGLWCLVVSSLPLVGWPAAFPLHLAAGLALVALWHFDGSPERRWYLLLLANLHWFTAALGVVAPTAMTVFGVGLVGPLFTTVAGIAGISLVAWRLLAWRGSQHLAVPTEGMTNGIDIWRWGLRVALVASLLASLLFDLGAAELVLAGIGLTAWVSDELLAAVQRELPWRVWLAQVIALLGVGYFVAHDVINFGHGISMFVVLAVGAVLWLASRFLRTRERLTVLAGPLRTTALVMPAVCVTIALGRELFGQATPWLGAHSLALLLAGGAYFAHGLQRRLRGSLIGSAVVLNVALLLLWSELSWSDPQLFMIPIGLSILMLTQLLRGAIPQAIHRPLHYIGALTILVSPTFHIVTGSWLHLFSLMLIAVVVMLGSIGLRLRALLYTGAAFLLADLVAMVVRGSVDRPDLLWIAGLALGAGVVTLGAITERHRENLLQNLRALGASLHTWS